MTINKKSLKKILKTGEYTYMVTLPKEWVKKLGWRAKKMVKIELHRREIRIKNAPRPRRAKQTVRKAAVKKKPSRKKS